MHLEQPLERMAVGGKPLAESAGSDPLAGLGAQAILLVGQIEDDRLSPHDFGMLRKHGVRVGWFAAAPAIDHCGNLAGLCRHGLRGPYDCCRPKTCHATCMRNKRSITLRAVRSWISRRAAISG